jgi:DnaK suppressor protein
MARREGLLRLHKRLLARRDALRKTLAGELEDLSGSVVGNVAGGDAADAAFGTGSDEIASQLAELEARELRQIERALLRLKQGSYGMCEECGKKIPVARLNALPYSTLCIECQREMEQHPRGDFHRGDWGKIYDYDSPAEEPRVDISDLEMDLSKQ